MTVTMSPGTDGVHPTQAENRRLADAATRKIEATRDKLFDWILLGAIARYLSKKDNAIGMALRAKVEEDEAARRGKEHWGSGRPLSPVVEILLTGFLMVANFWSNKTVLAFADIPDKAAWFLAIAFGPIFVIVFKTVVRALLDVAKEPKTTARRILLWGAVPLLLVGAATVAGGLAIKSMSVGVILPIGDDYVLWSSVAMFGGLVLGEFAAATALGVHAAIHGAATQLQSKRRRTERLTTKASRIKGRYQALAAKYDARMRFRFGRGELATSYGIRGASEVTDGVLPSITTLPPVVLAPAPGNLVEAPDPTPTPSTFSAEPMDPGTDLDEEFRKLLRGGEQEQEK